MMEMLLVLVFPLIPAIRALIREMAQMDLRKVVLQYQAARKAVFCRWQMHRAYLGMRTVRISDCLTLSLVQAGVE